MNNQFPFEKDLLQLGEGDEFVIFIKGRAFVVSPASDDDMERIGHGYYCLD